jgi:hypothetical protein
MSLRACSRLLAILTRPLALASLGVVAMAIALGQRHPPAPAHRGLRHDRQVWIRGDFIGDHRNSRLFDVETGLTIPLTRPAGAGGELTLASGSPWREDDGTWQIVGMWRRRLNGVTGPWKEVSLVRLSQPGGTILDRVEPEVYPNGPPCWFRGTSARVLFTGTDGRLFTWGFGGGGPSDRETDGQPLPRPLIWLTGSPGDEQVMLGDVCVPAGADLGRRVVVTRRPAFGPRGGALEPFRLWWLELDNRASAILRAGRLRPKGGEPPGGSERLPSVARTTDGRLILAYLLALEEPGRMGYQLRVAPIAIDEKTGDPTVETTAERTLAEGCLATAPVFSADARWVTGVLRADPPPRPLRRFAVDMNSSCPPQPRPTDSAKKPSCGDAP